jgi:hypothetical protein
MQKIYENPDVQIKSVKKMCDDNLANILKEEGKFSKVRFHHVDGHPLVYYLETDKLERDLYILMYAIIEFPDGQKVISNPTIYEPAH